MAHDDANRESSTYLWSAVIVVGFVGGALFLAQTGVKAQIRGHGGRALQARATQRQGGHRRERAQAAAHRQTHKRGPRTTRARGAARRHGRRGGHLGRGRFANRMNRRFRARGQAARVKATGQTKEVFEVSWLAKDDKAHRTRLMTAKRLFDELRNLGFKRVVFKVKGKVSFTKPLR